MSKKKRTLKFNTKYRVTCMAPEGGAIEVWGFLDELPRIATLDAILANCRRHRVDATVSAENGEHGGWVHPDGTYRIT
ncbi:hypothetical protein F0U61_36905 [Archangium violaceum]|uniref:hypothetical protein n=1 Tax=Archangium violaceum TaxID=83451 RepID=UPI002B28FEAB|nr:hypothetical protein F0U61_36905 [Archangium violaceum]